MSSSSYWLVADDQPFAEAIQNVLRHTFQDQPALCSFDAIQKECNQEARGLWIWAAASAEEARRIVPLLREIRLREWPVSPVLVEADTIAAADRLHRLDPYLLRRFSWPRDAAALATLPPLCEQLRRDRAHPFPVETHSALARSLAQHLLAHTPSTQRLLEPLLLAATHDVTVLLTGATGTGKTYLARLIHEHSARKAQPMMVVPCGALAGNLIESELFGHAKGAFTGADRAKVGKFEAVGAGTLLLDEIDTLGLEHQAKLLRVIETGAYEPVGSNDTRLCRARIIAASNWNLEEAVARGRFREDLFYRLNVLALSLEPLKDRPQDIAPLTRSLVAQFSAKFQKELFAISPEAIACLEAFPWPGNVRQLENVVQQAVLVSSGPELLRQHLPQPVREAAVPLRPTFVAAASNGSLVENRDQHERVLIEAALQEANNCRSRAAHALGISRGTLYNKMKKYGIPKVLLRDR